VQEATAAALPSYSYSAGVITAAANGALTVDGVAVQANDRVLVKNETGGNVPYNGIYAATSPGASGAPFVLTRAPDMAQGYQVPGSLVQAEQGTVAAGTLWQVVSAGPFVLGTTAITWTQFVGSGGTVASVTAGDASIVIGGTSTAPTVATGTLDVIATQHPPAASVPMAGKKLTGLGAGSAGTDSAQYGQTPAGGNTATIAQGGTGATTAAGAITNLGAVDTSSAQSIGGTKTFTGEVIVPAPVGSGDAVTKAYADAIASGLSVKPSVNEATAAALPANTYSAGVLTATGNGALTVDGVAVETADRVLVQNEATAANNGIYTVTNPGSGSAAYVLTRAADMNAGGQVPGAFCFVEQGTANAGAGFVVANEGPFTIGTTAIAWTQFSGAGEITAGTGLSKSGNTLNNTGVLGVTAGDASAVVGGTSANPTVETGTLDQVANLHPPAANWSNNGKKITSVGNGSASSDAAAYGQTPAGGNTATIAQGGTG